ncbi:MAG: RNA polymerase factor sigma-54 [Gammaproteobacteria bacterium]|nr:RNA polymerase factor sigma-54 [Gammaproteobacteria bacterium]
MMKPTLQLRIGQQLTMTPQLQQAIRLLQLPTLELQAQIQQALETNVMLEVEEDLEPTTSFEALAKIDRNEGDAAGADEPVVEISDEWTEPTAAESETPWSGSGDGSQDFEDEAGQTLQDHLIWQLEMAHLPAAALTIGRALIDAINDDGYLTETLEAIADAVAPEVIANEAEVGAVLAVIQQFDPPGVGARTIGECVELQLRQLDPATPGLDAAFILAHQHLELVAQQQFSLLQREMRCSGEELDIALALVRSCHPRPGSTIQPARTEFVVPDVYARRTPQGWLVELNPASVPRVKLNERYAAMLTREADHAVLRTQLQEARWLLRSLEIRNDTMLRVARSIVERQSAFLDRGEESMEPMILRDIAEAVQMHESTVSRVTTGKYLHTPRGVFEFRYFFSSQVTGDDGAGVSSTAIRAKIRKLIAQESPLQPLSDNQIAEMLSIDGVQVARRTVAKYREALGIPTSSERRRVATRKRSSPCS